MSQFTTTSTQDQAAEEGASHSFPGIGYVLGPSNSSELSPAPAEEKPENIVFEKKNGNVVINIKDKNIKEQLKQSDKRIFVVVDISYSMDKFYQKIDNIIKTIYDDNPLAEDVTIILYGSSCEVYTPSNYPKSADGTLISVGNYSIFTMGRGTNFVPPINECITNIHYNPGSKPIIYFMSDGQASCYLDSLQQLQSLVNAREGIIHAFAFGSNARLSGFRDVKNVNINQIVEQFSTLYSEFVQRQDAIFNSDGIDIKISLRLDNNIITAVFPKVVDISERCSVIVNGQVIPLTLIEAPPSEDKLEDQIDILESILQDPALYTKDNLSEVLQNIKELNSKNSEDSRVIQMNIKIDDLLKQMTLHQGGRNLGNNLSTTRSLDGLKLLIRIGNSIESGKMRRNIRNAGRKLAMYAAAAEECMAKLISAGHPPPPDICEVDTDVLGMEYTVGDLLWVAFNGPGNGSGSLIDVLEARSLENPPLEMIAVINAINSPESALVKAIYSATGICTKTLKDLKQTENLERLTFAKSAVFLPYTTNKIWLKKVLKIYAGLLIVGHPIELQSNSGAVFLTTCTELMRTGNFRALITIYNFANAYIDMKPGRDQESRFNIVKAYANDPCAIFKSRIEGGDCQLPSVFTAIGALLNVIGRQLYENEKISFDECTGLIQSILTENLRQFFRAKGRSDVKFLNKILLNILKNTKLDEYVDKPKDINIELLVQDMDQDLRQIGEGNISVRDVIDKLKKVVEIDRSGCKLDIDTVLDPEYIPSHTLPGCQCTVPKCLSFSDLTDILGFARYMVEKNIMVIAESYQGMIPEELCDQISGAPRYEIPNEMLLESVVNLIKTNLDTSELVKQPPSGPKEVIDCLPLSGTQKEICADRLAKLLIDSFEYMIKSKKSPIAIFGMLKVLLSVIPPDGLTDFHRSVFEVISNLRSQEKKNHLFKLMLDEIGCLILDENVSLECKEQYGVPVQMIEKMKIQMLTPKGIIKPTLKGFNNPFSKVVKIIEGNEITEQYIKHADNSTDEYTIGYKENGMTKMSRQQIFKIDGADVLKAANIIPELSKLSGFATMINGKCFEFIKKNGTYICISINGIYREIIKPMNPNDTVRFPWPEELLQIKGLFSDSIENSSSSGAAASAN